MDKTGKRQCLLLRKFWLQLPKVYFWRGDCLLAFVSTQIWDLFLFPNFLSLKVVLLPYNKFVFIYVNESSLKMMKNAFYFLLETLSFLRYLHFCL